MPQSHSCHTHLVTYTAMYTCMYAYSEVERMTYARPSHSICWVLVAMYREIAGSNSRRMLASYAWQIGFSSTGYIPTPSDLLDLGEVIAMPAEITLPHYFERYRGVELYQRNHCFILGGFIPTHNACQNCCWIVGKSWFVSHWECRESCWIM